MDTPVAGAPLFLQEDMGELTFIEFHQWVIRCGRLRNHSNGNRPFNISRDLELTHLLPEHMVTIAWFADPRTKHDLESSSSCHVCLDDSMHSKYMLKMMEEKAPRSGDIHNFHYIQTILNSVAPMNRSVYYKVLASIECIDIGSIFYFACKGTLDNGKSCRNKLFKYIEDFLACSNCDMYTCYQQAKAEYLMPVQISDYTGKMVVYFKDSAEKLLGYSARDFRALVGKEDFHKKLREVMCGKYELFLKFTLQEPSGCGDMQVRAIVLDCKFLGEQDP
eukprot:g6822.t1